MNKAKHILILFFAIFLWTCKTQKISTTQNDPQEKTAFYDLKFNWDSVNKKSIISINKISINDNKTRYIMNEEAAKLPSSVYLEIVDKSKNTIKVYAEHPLFRKFDLFSESGEIEAKLVSLPEADLIVRVPYFAPYKTIKIVESINGKQTATTLLKNEK